MIDGLYICKTRYYNNEQINRYPLQEAKEVEEERS